MGKVGKGYEMDLIEVFEGYVMILITLFCVRELLALKFFFFLGNLDEINRNTRNGSRFRGMNELFSLI